MEHNTPPLTTVQQCVVNALAAGSTLSDAAEKYGVHRVTVYRWMKTFRPFTDALHRARAEFVLDRRDDLYKLSNRAVEILMAILNNPESSPAVPLRTAMFILQRPQLPKTGWSMPEPAPDPDGNKLLDSAIIEQDYDSLPGLANIERDFPADDPVEPPAEPEPPAESATSEPPPPPEPPATPPADATACNQMQHNSPICDDVAPPAVRQLGCAPAPFPTCATWSIPRDHYPSSQSKAKILLRTQQPMKKKPRSNLGNKSLDSHGVICSEHAERFSWEHVGLRAHCRGPA